MAESPLTFIELITNYKESTALCDAGEAAHKIKTEDDLTLVDVRESVEFEEQPVPGAVKIPRGFLEFKIAQSCADANQPILIHCTTGGRAVLAARTLAKLGYKNVSAYQGTVDDLLAATA